MTTAFIIAGFSVSTVGFSFFIYGKKQGRLPQLVVGMLLMASPFFVTDPMWLSFAAVLILIGLRVAIADG